MFILAVKDERGALVSEHEITEDVLKIGRTATNDVVLPHTSVSRQHACLYAEGGRVFIGDMGSANGIFVDDVKIQDEMMVGPENSIRVGNYVLVLEPLEPSSSGNGIQTAEVAPDKAHGKLIVLSGAQASREILLFEPITTIGRIEENDVHLPDISVSRHHARLHYHHDGSYILQDLKSSNGTHVMGQKLHTPARVSPGDRIHFGNVECLLAQTQGPTRMRTPGRKMVIYGLLAFSAVLLGIILAIVSKG